ncbi:MAG: choice-of-anchor J domain-containing protein [Hyphomicrobiales bacterium]
MKKIFTISVLLLLLSTIAFSQGDKPRTNYFAGFNSWPEEGWTTVNTGDNSSKGWIFIDFILKTGVFEGNGCAGHLDDDDNGEENTVDYLISPKIKVTEGAVLSFYEVNYYMSAYIEHSLLISTGSPNIEDGDFVLFEELNGNTHFKWEQRTFELTEYVGKDVYFAFKFEGDYSTKWYIDNFSVSTPQKFDGIVSDLLVPTVIMITGEPINCTGEFYNNGNVDIENAVASLDINGDTQDKQFNIPAGEKVSVDFEPWESKQGKHTVSLTLQVKDEVNTENNSIEKIIDVHDPASANCYGYVTLNDDQEFPYGPVMYDIYHPLEIWNFKHKTEDWFQPYAGTMIYNMWFCNYTEVVDNREPKRGRKADSWRLIDTDDGSTVFCGKADLVLDEMAYDYSKDVLYGIGDSKLYTIDLKTYECKQVGEKFKEVISAFAIDTEGVGYVICEDENLYSIDLSTFTLTLIGHTGINNVEYLQSMAFDHTTGKLFWNLCNGSCGQAYYVDHKTAETYVINFLKDNAQVTCFGFRYGKAKSYLAFNSLKGGNPYPIKITIGDQEKETNEKGQVGFFPFEDEQEVSFSYEYDGKTMNNSVVILGNTIYDISETSTSIVDNKELDIYPNPASDYFNIKNAKNAKITISSIDGKVFKSLTSNSANYKLNISEFTDGVYIIRLIKDNKISTSKLIIRK